MRERPETQPEINKFRRETLIEATIQIVAKHGIENATFAKICEAAGVSRGLPGHYFRDKDDLLCQAYQHLLDLHVAHTTSAVRAVKGNASDRLKAFVKACLPSDGSTRHYRTAYLAFWTLSMGNKKMVKITSDSYAVLYESVATLFRDAAEESSVNLDPHEETVTLIGLIDGMWLDISIGASGISQKSAVGTISKHVDRILASHSHAPAQSARTDRH
jgi:TetR/AcrR family transcriptional regulator, transcriptional repressor of bet genes